MQPNSFDPSYYTSPKFILKSAKIALIYDLKNSVCELAASTYGAISQWNNFKKDQTDIEIEALSKKIKGRHIDEEDEFKALYGKLYLLSGKDDSPEAKLLKKVEELIDARRDFSLLKNVAKFPLMYKLNICGGAFTLLSFTALKLNMTSNPNYFIYSFMAETAYLTGSIAYRIIWEKCWFQPSLKGEAESLRKMAKDVYKKFQPDPPDINDLSGKKFYEIKLQEHQQEWEKKANKRQKPLLLTNGD